MKIFSRRQNPNRKADDGPFYITETGLERLKGRLLRVKAAIPDLAAEAQRTAAFGDRSDNAAYKDSKSLLRRAHRQVLSMEDQIKRAVVISEDPSTNGIVQLGSTVTIQARGIKKVFQILGPHETNPTRGRISHLSPLGAALINHKIDDVVAVKTEAGAQEYKILEVK